MKTVSITTPRARTLAPDLSSNYVSKRYLSFPKRPGHLLESEPERNGIHHACWHQETGDGVVDVGGGGKQGGGPQTVYDPAMK